ncbi:penicillin-binding protein 1A [Desulfobaculum xiamenense]|uniref:Penicillin-binding protein 1A n=1 Tax=Desulfobaculum xiamenense TaxID=995050 RepID=A0A846QW84_9BACT|nr:PBP1A family penicillin-binding protein [Desulfobaculum xiamenense]NJB68889.1 penicillin-binding protein 1A [Desulfobaculum xiamenense]
MKKILLVLGGLAGVGALCAVALIGMLYYWASRDLPDFENITDYNPPLATTVYTCDDRVLGYFYREKRFLVRLEDMPGYLPRCFLAAEDSGFYEHEGVDLGAIFRAFVKNLQAGHVVQGGSTITQQVIKSLLLTPERSYKRKIKEAILAYRLESYLTKDEILTIYLNQIFFGARAYGIEAAARVYFGVHVNELTLGQAAILAGLPKGPSAYNPYRNLQGALNRKHYVLGRMLEMEWITREQYDAALAEPVVLKSMEDPSWQQGAYYLEEVRRRLIDRFGEDAVYTAGMHVHSAVDLTHQVAAEQALRRGLIDSARRRGWIGPNRHLEEGEWSSFLTSTPHVVEALVPGEWVEVLVTGVERDSAEVRFGQFRGAIGVDTVHWARIPDPTKATEEVPSVRDCRTILSPGDVVWASVTEIPAAIAQGTNPEAAVWPLALEREPEVQGALVSMEPATGEVRALVGGYSFETSQFNRATQASRQPGSAFKPIVYSTAFDNGMTPSTVMLDAPIVYTDYENDRTWKPDNFEGVFYGPTILRTALVKSRNLVTIRIAQQLGIRKIIERAQAMGLESEFPEDLSVSLGSSPVTPLNLTQAYSAFARGGSWIKPRLILKVESAWGKELFVNQPETAEALSPETAYIINCLLKEVVRDGTGWRVRRAFNRPIAGKTGTSNNEQDAWFVGYTPHLLTTVYVGFDQMAPMGKYETGSRAASPIWVDYRKAVEANYPEADFPQPPGIVMTRIDAATGLLAGPGTERSYFLPYKAGTQPTETAEPDATAPTNGSSAAGENLLKQIF